VLGGDARNRRVLLSDLPSEMSLKQRGFCSRRGPEKAIARFLDRGERALIAACGWCRAEASEVLAPPPSCPWEQ